MWMHVLNALYDHQDLAVKREGWFAFQYRILHIHDRVRGCGPNPILAECKGGSFQIYATKSFPGLSVSTDLTQVIISHPNSRVYETRN